MRKPTASRKDIIKIGLKLKSFFQSVQEVKKNLFVVTLLVIPFHGNPISYKINKILLVIQLKYYQNKLKLTHPILWMFLPNAVGAFGSFGEKLSVYYITDDFTEFTGHPSYAIAKMEAQLIDRCDVVIASAKRLAEKKKRGRKPIHVISHGVCYQHFAKTINIKSEEWPDDIKDLKKPIIGFYGEINDWIDLEILCDAAQKQPDWSFVLIGRVAVEVGNIDFLKNQPNIHLLGQKQFNELPEYCAAFDVALIPKKLNELTLSMNPLKLKEYLAAGVPVVSAPLPEVMPYKDVVKFATNADDLIKAVEELLIQNRNQMAPILSKRVANESWDAKVEEISCVVEETLKKKGVA